MITSENLSISSHALDLAIKKSLTMPRASSVVGSVQSLHENHVLGDESTMNYMQNLTKNSDGDNPLEDWSVFYCGGSNAVSNILRDVTSKYSIGFALEKFDW